NPSNLTALGGKLYFSATANNPTNGNVGTELFVYDPATATTSLVADLTTGSGSSSPNFLKALGGRLYFVATANNATDGNVGQELYVHDPATGTTKLLRDFYTGSSGSGVSNMTALDGKLYFTTFGNNSIDGFVGNELYVYNPATDTT